MKCIYCNRERDIKKINSTNWNRHLNACRIKNKGGSKIDHFFIKNKSSDISKLFNLICIYLP